MGAITTTNLLTFEEFERLPDRPGKQELLEGELIELPPATIKHDRRSHWIFKLLTRALEAAHARGEGSELGEVFLETGYKLSRNTYVKPDVSVTHAGQSEGDHLEGAPAIAIEVISPSNKAEDMETKTELYFRHGGREVWRFYPKTQHVEVRVGTSARIERETVTTPLLPGFALNIAEVFDPPKV
jgi:Uma2 family endonuclease